MKVLKKARNPYIEANKRRNIFRFLLSIMAGIVLIVAAFQYTVWLLFVAWLPFLISGLFLRRYHTWEAGIRGEREVVKALQELDDSHYLLNGIVLPRGKGDIDHVLLGPKGVFVIETKNYSGKVICDGDNWHRRRQAGQRKTPVESISEQAKRNALDLDHFLKKKSRRNVDVTPICVFVNPSVELELKNPTLPVLQLKGLTKFIKDAQPTSALTEQEIKNLSNAILKGSSR